MLTGIIVLAVVRGASTVEDPPCSFACISELALQMTGSLLILLVVFDVV
jgi:hypothetical protein